MLIARFKQLHSLESPAPPDTPMLPMICRSTSLRGIPPANVTRWQLVSSMPFAPLGSTMRLGDHNIKGHWRFSVEATGAHSSCMFRARQIHGKFMVSEFYLQL
jgi:hypothetical protein